MMNTVNIEIWSDVVCPFCYIGKRKLELALDQFPAKDLVSISFRSFQLSPETVTDPRRSLDEYLARLKGISEEEARAMNAYVAGLAEKVGLRFNLDNAVPANTFRAHQLIHYAKSNGKEKEMTEALFKAYFTGGRNIDDEAVLANCAGELDLDRSDALIALKEERYSGAVRQDLEEAQKAKISGVPFFLFNRKYAVSGAREPEVMLKALELSRRA